MKTPIAIAATLLLALVMAVPVALAQRTIVYDRNQTKLRDCISLCRRGTQYVCSSTCVARTADGGFPREYEVDATGATMNACLTSLQAECVP